MNIFILDLDPIKCAQYHVDRHVVKMITEYAQMLSTASRLSGIDIGYKITHQNHPCTKWTRMSLSNWLWLKNLARCLNDEWKFRYEHTVNHKSYNVIESLPVPNIPELGLTPFAICMDNEFKLNNDPVESYRNYYRKSKSHLFSWKNRAVPTWVDQIENN